MSITAAPAREAPVEQPAEHLEAPGAPPAPTPIGQRLITAALVAGPLIGLATVVPTLWGNAAHLRDIIMAVVLYLVTGFGVTVGFHRLLTHRSFRARRGLKIALAVAGSLAVQGSVVSWVSAHRRHHMFSDHDGDPHSPYRFGADTPALVRGFFHAHIGWLFRGDDSPAERFAPDILRDRDLVVIGRLFPLLAVVSLGVPFAIGWAMSGHVSDGVTAFLWAGLVRMALLHHVAWSVNSVCHMFGNRPFASKDRSTNFAPLALLSLGESWHNGHHASPAAARHGALRGQLDLSASLIRLFEVVGLATKVRWPRRLRRAEVTLASTPSPTAR